MTGVAIQDFADEFHAAVAETFGSVPHAAKMLARATGASIRAAEDWLHGKRVARSEQLVNMMAANPAFCSRIMALLPKAGGGEH